MTGATRLTDFDYRVPPAWHPIPTERVDTGWEALVAEQLCDGDDARAVLSARLAETHPALTRQPHQGLAVWVPDRQTPEVIGVLLIDVLLGEPGRPADRERYRSLLDPDPPTGTTEYWRSIDDTEINAGPALLVQELISSQGTDAEPGGRLLEEHVIYTVFPHGCTDAVELTFWTPVLALGDRLASDAADLTETLTITLDGGQE